MPSHCDVCVVGAGAAGITLACELAGTRLKVVVLEAGGLEPDVDVQSLYAGERVGLENAHPGWCRLRYFGGTTNHWNGWCAPFKEVDFSHRSWVPESGWPIDLADLNGFYDRARAFCQIGPAQDPKASSPEQRSLLAQFGSALRVDQFSFSPPTRFGQAYREDLRKAPNIEVYLNANVTGIGAGSDGRHAQEVRVSTLDQSKQRTIRPRIVVLACGGMENPRLLLVSDDVRAEGLANDSGLVGRYFTQHIEGVVGQILSPDAERLRQTFVRNKAGEFRWELTTLKEVQERHRMLNTGFTINVRRETGEGYDSLRQIWSDLRAGEWPDELGTRIGTVFSDFGSVAEGFMDHAPSLVDVTMRAEQSPNPDSRVSLSDERDRFGLRKLRVDWRLSSFDRQSIRESTIRVGEALGRLELGRLRLEDWVADESLPWPQPIWSGCHHMGTTRMSLEPARGVVNADCRTHGMDNLYIAGSSVFPTGGYVPPTLTIVAMTIRLADHLKNELFRHRV